jgi:hypothetical protein
MVGIVMRRFLHFLFAIAVVFGTTGAGLRRTLEVPAACGCGCGEAIDPVESTCPCGMPMRSPQPCGSGAAQGLPSPTRAVVEQVVAVSSARRTESHPCPLPLVLEFRVEAERRLPDPVSGGRGTDPPRRSLDRLAQLSVFRI